MKNKLQLLLLVLFSYYTGQQMQQFDYSREDEKEFMCAVASPSGHSVVIGSFNRFVLELLSIYYWYMVYNTLQLSVGERTVNSFNVPGFFFASKSTCFPCLITLPLFFLFLIG